MATFGSLTSATSANNTYTGTGGFDVVNYYQSKNNYSITYDAPNDKITVRNNKTGVIDTLIGISEIYFNAGNPDVWLAPKVLNFNYPANSPYINLYLSAGAQNISLDAWATVVVGQGNETIVNDLYPTSRTLGTVAFWGSTKGANVDLESGRATSGDGYAITIKNIYHVRFNGANGDTAYGSSGSDTFYFDGFTKGNASFIDGRDGVDTADFYSGLLSEYILKTSVDGKTTTIQRNGYTANFNNVETFLFHQNGTQNISLNYKDFIDFSAVGPATLIASKNLWQNTLSAQGNQLSFSFMSASPSYGGADGGTGFTAPTENYKTAVKSILSQLSKFIGIDFVEISDATSSYGQLRFGANQQASTKGYSFNPSDSATDKAGDVWLDVETLSLMSPGQEGYQVLLHEVGHALGLIHPQGETDPVTGTSARLLGQWNNNLYTVMSDVQASNHLWQSWFGPLDMQALQTLYGAKAASFNPADTNYVLKDADGQKLQTLSDAGGLNTIDCSGLTLGVSISLRPNTFSSVGKTMDDLAAFNNMYIDSLTIIQNVSGSRFDDVLIGNDQSNVFYPLEGNDIIDGKGGINRAVFQGAAGGYSWDINASNQHLNVADKGQKLGNKDLFNIQRLNFSDTNIAFDLMPTDSGGKTAQILGAAFGLSALSNKPYVGIGLSLFDGAMGLQDVATLAIQTGLVSAPDNTSFVKAVWSNVVGSPIDDANLNTYVGQLNKDAFTQASLLVLAATSSFNTSHINLAGLAQTGLEYV